MPEAVSNTSPLLYLHRIGSLEWLPELLSDIWIPEAVRAELRAGKSKGYDVPTLDDHPWAQIVNPAVTPPEWFALDLGAGELAAMALALENPTRVVLLDDMLARRTAQAAGLQVWGTLKILLEAKTQGLTSAVHPHISKLIASGMWISAEARHRILQLADEA